MDAAPFRAVRYHPDVAGELATTTAPSYEEVERFAYAAHRASSPYTVLELLSPASGFAAASDTFRRWLRTGVLLRDPRPAFYTYEEHELRGGVPAVQRGVLAAVRLAALDDPEDLLPHEGIDTDRAAARLARLEAVPLDVSPVFALMVGLHHDLRSLLDRAPRQPPVVAVTDEAGVDHRVWRVDDPADIATVREGLVGATAVIADGHHRYAAALAFRDRQRARRGLRPDAPWERTLVYLVDAHAYGPRILPIHRLVRGLDDRALRRLETDVAVTPQPGGPRDILAALEGSAGPAFGLWRQGRGAVLRPHAPDVLRSRLPAGMSGAWRDLDVAVLEHGVLPTVTTPDRVETRSDLDAATADCATDPTAGLFLLRPVDADSVLDLARSGERMPAKATSFVPKPRTGLVMRDVDD